MKIETPFLSFLEISFSKDVGSVFSCIGPLKWLQWAGHIQRILLVPLVSDFHWISLSR